MCIPTAIHPAHERHGNKFEKGNEKWIIHFFNIQNHWVIDFVHRQEF
jgi:hypothetical protein